MLLWWSCRCGDVKGHIVYGHFESFITLKRKYIGGTYDLVHVGGGEVSEPSLMSSALSGLGLVLLLLMFSGALKFRFVTSSH